MSDNDNTAFIVLTVVCGFVGVLLVANVALWYAAQKTAGDRKGKKVVSKKKARREAMMRGFTVPGD